MAGPAAKLVTPFVALLVALLGAIFGPKLGGVNTSDVGTYAAVAIGGLLTAMHGKKIAPVTKAVVRKAAPKRKPPPAPRPPWFGLDWAWGAISPKALKTVGASFACRYLSNDPSKDLTPGESRRLAAAGIKRVVVWETSANRATGGFPAGVADAENALRRARACGLPTAGEWAIYFAIDFDANGPEVTRYFEGARAVLKKEHTGAYGGIRPLRHLFNQGLIAYGWQTYAWSAGQWEKRAHLIQFSNGHVVAGVQVDFDRALQPAYGQW
jgi:hypothetical protein